MLLLPSPSQVGMYIYSIRIRLLDPSEEGGLSEEARGFRTAQLRSRHWLISKGEGEEPEHVNGEGVIGRYPLLREGGFRDDKQDNASVRGKKTSPRDLPAGKVTKQT